MVIRFWLAANHHENKVIAIDNDVMKALIKYHEMIRQAVIDNAKKDN